MRPCYYHNSPITHFCTHVKCTLPLCQQCLPLHKEETKSQPSHDFSRHVLSIDESKSKALAWLRADTTGANSAIDSLDRKLNILRQEVIKTLDNELVLLRHEIIQTHGLEHQMNKLRESEMLIQQGSIKELIKAHEHYGWVDNTRQWAEAVRQVKGAKVSFQFNSLSKLLAWSRDELNIGSGVQNLKSKTPNEENSTWKQLSVIKAMSPRPKKGLQIAANLPKLESSEVSSYHGLTPNNGSSWRSVVNTKDVYMASPRASHLHP